MCVVSMITDHYQQRWPDPNRVEITRWEWEEYQTLKRKAYQYDIDNKQPECVKPDVDKWEKQLKHT